MTVSCLREQGSNGSSGIRRVDLDTGRILQYYALSEEYFGEGITTFGDSLIQLTWQSHIGFVYNKISFQRLQQFSYPTEGWGITHDDKQLIMSDGTSKLYFLDPKTLVQTGSIEVQDQGVACVQYQRT